MSNSVLASIVEASTVREAAELARAESERCGSIGGTFHVAKPLSSQVGRNVYIGIWGYGEEWKRDYLDPLKRAHDPIPDGIMRGAHAKVHSEAVQEIEMTSDERSVFDYFHASRQKRTLGIPAYGPFDIDSYMSVTLANDFRPEDDGLITYLVSLAEVCNRRIGQLLGGSNTDKVLLSERETEVLGWIARSKSNGDIGTILGVSAATIDTYVRRIFAKLDVNDRISASLKGVRLGLVRF